MKINNSTQTMKYIMENFRRYQVKLESEFGKPDNVVYLFENNKKVPILSTFDALMEQQRAGHVSERELINIWEKSFDYEAKEIERLYLLHEQNEEAVPTEVGGETVEAPGWLRKLGQLFNKALEQAAQLLSAIKNSLKSIAAFITKIYNFVQKYCAKAPTLCKVVKFLLMMLIITAVMALFSSQAEAAVQATTASGKSVVLNDEGISALKGSLQFMTEDKDPEVQQAGVDAFRWLEKAHTAETTVDLAESSEAGAIMCERAFKGMENMIKAEAEAGEYSAGSYLNAFIKWGEKVVIRSKSYSETVYATGMGTHTQHVEWESLELPK